MQHISPREGSCLLLTGWTRFWGIGNAQTRGLADAKQCYAEIECGGSGTTEPKSEKADNACRDKTNFGTKRQHWRGYRSALRRPVPGNPYGYGAKEPCHEAAGSRTVTALDRPCRLVPYSQRETNDPRRIFATAVPPGGGRGDGRRFYGAARGERAWRAYGDRHVNDANEGSRSGLRGNRCGLRNVVDWRGCTL